MLARSHPAGRRLGWQPASVGHGEGSTHSNIPTTHRSVLPLTLILITELPGGNDF